MEMTLHESDRYSPEWTAAYYDDYAEKEWDRF